MGNLIEEITSSEYSHCHSQRSTSTIQQSVASISPEVISKLKFLQKAYEEQKQRSEFLEKTYEVQKQQNQYILSLLESRGIQVNFETAPHTSHAAARIGESVSQSLIFQRMLNSLNAQSNM
ncbi:hypothetical protein DsansV1_C25g0185621 [Dioscorea sansibarensis]